MSAASGYELNKLQNRFADLLDVHPMHDWSPALLRAMIGTVELFVDELGLDHPPAAVLSFVRNQTPD
jgi:hypothetical protein